MLSWINLGRYIDENQITDSFLDLPIAPLNWNILANEFAYDDSFHIAASKYIEKRIKEDS